MIEETLHTAPFIVLSCYLANFSTAANSPCQPVLMSSADIQAALSDMCSISIDEIANVLVSLGFKISLEADGSPRWAMYPND